MTTIEQQLSTETFVVGPNEGKALAAFGDVLQVKLSAEYTGGGLSILLGTCPPGGGPPPHIHHNEDEIFLMLEGRCVFLANGEWVEVVPGSMVYAPRGVVHAFKNIGDTPVRAWIVTTPSGFETFFSKCADVFAEAGAGPPDMGRILNISDEHGIEYVPPIAPPISGEMPLADAR